MEILKFKDWLKRRNVDYTFFITSQLGAPLSKINSNNMFDYIKQVEERIKRKPIVNPKTGEINMKYNPMNITEDYYIAQRG